jgi:hypothetical protein
MVWNADATAAGLRPQGARDFLYQLSPPETIDWAVSRLTPEPVAPFREPVDCLPERRGRTPLYYFGCRQDRVVPPAAQSRACSLLSPTRVCELDADHSPFFSVPRDLAALLSGVAGNS